MTDATRRPASRTPAVAPEAVPPTPTADFPSDSFIRRAGRQFIVNVYGALRVIRLYPPENEAVANALAELVTAARTMIERDGELELKVSNEFLFVNSTRLRLELDNYASFSHLISVLRKCGIGSVRVSAAAQPRDWLVLLSTLLSLSRESDVVYQDVAEKLEAAGVLAFELGAPLATDDDSDFMRRAKEAAKRTYSHSVAVTREVMSSVRMGHSPNIKKIKRVVQTIVDQILNEETSLVGLTTIRDYDEYTFTHSVNVCIFSVALGRRLGLTKLQLYDLGLAALFHDIGKSRVPLSVLNKVEGLTDDDWRWLAAHPWLGVLALFHMRGQQELPYRAMVVAYEHHMKNDLSGYPRSIRSRAQSIYSKIVAVADGFDAATTRRAYQTVPMSPAAVLAGMRDNPRRGFDPVIVKGFINLVGVYPVGTLVVLDTFELALVHSVNPNPLAISRPLVRVVSDDRGNVLYPGELVDLTEQTAQGTYRRTIIKTENPDRYGINVGDYFV
ncbi:MAG TPA: HD domain-containing phosphohydrolase [Gemmatimonadaceae bacterium]|nr:HD domain-containing phosphohydrolase [Gemmatimonadaceae bacterium]